MTPDQMTADQRALIAGMNRSFTGFNPFTGKVERHRESNIAAVHFDGQMLVDMVAAHRELVEKLPPVR